MRPSVETVLDIDSKGLAGNFDGPVFVESDIGAAVSDGDRAVTLDFEELLGAHDRAQRGGHAQVSRGAHFHAFARNYLKILACI